jgi:hypothetical protein
MDSLSKFLQDYSARPSPADIYRERAAAIRAFVPTLRSSEVKHELLFLAAHYERLSEFAASATLPETTRRRPS